MSHFRFACVDAFRYLYLRCPLTLANLFRCIAARWLFVMPPAQLDRSICLRTESTTSIISATTLDSSASFWPISTRYPVASNAQFQCETGVFVNFHACAQTNEKPPTLWALPRRTLLSGRRDGECCSCLGNQRRRTPGAQLAQQICPPIRTRIPTQGIDC